MSDIWDQFTGSSGFVTFANIGDGIVGEVIAVRVGEDFKKNPCPELVIRNADGDDLTATCGQATLKTKLAELRPAPGERVSIVYSADGTGKPGQNPAKLFTVVVKNAAGEMRGDVEMAGATATTPAPQPAAAVSASALLDGL